MERLFYVRKCSTELTIHQMKLVIRGLLGTDHLTCKGGRYGFLFRSEIFFRTTRELEYLFYFVAQSANLSSRIQH